MISLTMATMKATTNSSNSSISEAYIQFLKDVIPSASHEALGEIAADLLGFHGVVKSTLSLKPKTKSVKTAKVKTDITEEERGKNAESGKSATGWNFFQSFVVRVMKEVETKKSPTVLDFPVMPTRKRTVPTDTVRTMIGLLPADLWNELTTFGALIDVVLTVGITSHVKIASLLWTILSDEERLRVREQ